MLRSLWRQWKKEWTRSSLRPVRPARASSYRPILEGLEDRVTPSTLNIDSFGNAVYTPTFLENTNLTLSAQNLSGGHFQQHTFTDTAEDITVTGPGAGKCTGSGTTFVTFNGTLNTITVNSSNGQDTITVGQTDVPILNVGNTGTITVNVEATTGALGIFYPNQVGFLNVNIGNAGSLQGIQGQVTLTNASGGFTNVNLTVNDSADGSVRGTATISSTQITGLSSSPIVYAKAGLSGLTVKGGSAADTFTIPSTLAFPRQETLFCGTGANNVNILATQSNFEVVAGTGTTVTIGSNGPALGGTLGTIQNGTVTVANASGTSFASLVLDDSGDKIGQTFNIGANTMGITGKLNVVTLVASETLHTGSGTNIINVNGIAAFNTLNLDLGTGNNTVNVFAHNTAAFPTEVLHGPLNINGSGAAYTLNYSDSGGTAGQTYTLSSTKLTRTNEAAIAYSPGATVNITTGKGNDTLTVSSVQIGHPVTLTGGGGNDTLQTNNGAHIFNLTGHNAGNFSGITFAGFQNLVGGTGRDAFRFTNNSAVFDGTINGGGGGDFLDYSGYTIPVTVNLITGSATGVDGGKAGGISNIQNVIGSESNDTLTGDAQGNILIGGASSNVINGGSGASILMAGPGTATVNGGSGNDILIGGTTVFDANYAALDSLLAEWQSSKTYAQRISDLKNGGGLNGANRLVLNTTVLGGGADFLTGKGPNDWFFEFPGDTILGFVPGEQIN
jgi:hypothetical protein